MDNININDLWFYYLSISKDMENTSLYVEPREQENVYSLEFCKIIVLSCVELETVLKAICYKAEGGKHGDIGDYKKVILSHFPKIVEAEVIVSRYEKTIKPFESWNNRLFWWDAYQTVKHGFGDSFKAGTYKNAVYALAALYISILYYMRITNSKLSTYNNGYLTSDYEDHVLSIGGLKQLPDFNN